MPRQSSISTIEQWKERVSNQRDSGLSIAAWCRQNNIATQTFYYWRDKFYPKPSLKRADFKEALSQQNIDTQTRKSGVSLQYLGFCINLEQNFDKAVLKGCLELLKELPC